MICQQIEFIYLILIIYLFITIELSHSSCMPWGISSWRHCDPFDCQWGPWKSFTKCSKSCGSGKQTRSRSKSITERNGGKCRGSPNETKSCNVQNCPINCKWGPWKSFTKCSKSCGSGTQTRSRSKSIIERDGGKCRGSPNETKSCNNQNCPTKCKWKGKRCVKVWKRKGKRNKKIFCNPKNCPSI